MHKLIMLRGNSGSGKTTVAKELQELLVKTCIDFLKEHECNEVDVVSFSVDDLKASVEEGKWHPASDSGIRLFKYVKGGFEELASYM